MRVNFNVLILLGAFFALLDAVYITWALLTYGRLEPVGTSAFTLLAVMALFIGFYLVRAFKAQGGELPEDRIDATVDDGDPEIGFFSPFSWWPILLAFSAALGFLGIAVGWWILFIAFVVFVITILGWVYEYYRGPFAR